VHVCAAMQTQKQIIKEKLAENYVYFLFVFSYIYILYALTLGLFTVVADTKTIISTKRYLIKFNSCFF